MSLCKFIKDLIEIDLGTPMYVERDDKYRQFKPIQVAENLWLSIQASYAHYSKPRKTIDKEEYTHWEIALFTKEEFVQIQFALPEFASLAEIELYFEGSKYPYVPADLVEEIYLALK
jgi:hypothetical protein